MDTPKPKASLLQAIIIAIISIALLAYLVIALNTGDLQWFLSGFDGLPASILVHCYGEDIVVNAGDPSYQAINEAVNSALSGSKRWDQLSISDITYAEYQTSSDSMVIELIYDPPVRIHSFYKFFKNVDTMVIPLDGRHASSNAVFGYVRDNMIPGSLHVDSMQSVVDALAQEDLCIKK